MFSISKERTVSLGYKGLNVEVFFRVPNAVEAEEMFKKEKSNTSIFADFVTMVISEDIDGWADGVDAQTVLETPGLYAVVKDTAVEIVNATFLTSVEKN